MNARFRKRWRLNALIFLIAFGALPYCIVAQGLDSLKPNKAQELDSLKPNNTPPTMAKGSTSFNGEFGGSFAAVPFSAHFEQSFSSTFANTFFIRAGIGASITGFVNTGCMVGYILGERNCVEVFGGFLYDLYYNVPDQYSGYVKGLKPCCGIVYRWQSPEAKGVIFRIGISPVWIDPSNPVITNRIALFPLISSGLRF